MTVRVDGERIQRLRKQFAWTQEQLAEKSGLATRTIQRLEHGEDASPESVQAIAATFGVSPDEIVSEPQRTHFSAPWGRKLKITTATFVVIILLATASLGTDTWRIGVGIVLLAALLSIRGYSVIDGYVLIHRLGWSTRLDLSRLQSIEAQPGVMAGSARLLGIGGLFAFLGTFRSELLGTYRAYATDGANAVLLELDNANVVVTPDSPAEFVRAVLAESPLSG